MIEKIALALTTAAVCAYIALSPSPSKPGYVGSANTIMEPLRKEFVGTCWNAQNLSESSLALTDILNRRNALLQREGLPLGCERWVCRASDSGNFMQIEYPTTPSCDYQE